VNFAAIFQYAPNLVSGALVTLRITLVAAALGLVIGLGLALARLARVRLLSWIAYAYIELFRTTPPLVQIVWFYFVVPVLTGHELSSFQAAALALGLNEAAFLAEIMRAGIQGVSTTQRDAARVLGLTTFDTYRFVILPQAFRIILPPAATTLMLLVKTTALASAIGTLELMRVGQLVTTATFRPIEVLTTVALAYFLLTYPIAIGARALERSFRVGQG